MNNINSSIEKLKDLSVKIGLNNRFIQASGGNTSFKIGNKIWVKASGKQLKDANKEDIFVCLENKEKHYCFIDLDINNIQLKPVGINPLKASIETLLHAIMPYSFVVHSHPLDIIRETVIVDNYENISKLMFGFKWTVVDYIKPGEELAREVFYKIKNKDIDVVILSNHGLIVGGDNATEVLQKHGAIIKRFSRRSRKEKKIDSKKIIEIQSLLIKKTSINWRIPRFELIHSLATDDWSFKLATMNPLYPDHLVFCDKLACCINYEDLDNISEIELVNKKYLIIKNIGVFLNGKSSFATEEMLEAQAYINLSIPKETMVKTLSNIECSDLQSWDAEKYRLELMKKRESS